MLLEYFICTLKGNFRENNEDNLYADGIYFEANHDDKILMGKCRTRDRPVFGVFDGLGGEEKGETASFTAAESLNSFCGSSEEFDFGKFFKEANRKVAEIRKTPADKMTGSTAAVVSFDENCARWANLGDSRIYIIRDKECTQVSIDHTMTETLISSGVLTREASRKSPYRNYLTRCLGMDKVSVSPYISEESNIREGDIFIICSDGFSGHISADNIYGIISEYIDSENIAYSLACEAYKKGAHDNTTVIVIFVKADRKRLFFGRL